VLVWGKLINNGFNDGNGVEVLAEWKQCGMGITPNIIVHTVI
jgi:hypothetical protein